MAGKSNRLTIFFILYIIFALLIISNSFSHVRLTLTDRLYGSNEALDDIVIVKIDDESIQNIGRWPWDRDVFPQILSNINDAKVIGLDISFFETSNNDLSLNKSLENLDNVVLAAEVNDNVLYKPIFPSDFGYVNLITDDDGVTRSVDSGLKANALPFSFKIYEKIYGNIEKKDKVYLINFVSDNFNSISAHELIESNYSFKDKIVLIGATAPDLHDSYFAPTSQGNAINGIEIHASILQNLIIDNFLVRQSKLSILVIVFISLLNGILLSRIKISYLIPIVISIFIFYILIAIFVFNNYNYVLDLFFFPLSIIIFTGAGISINYLEEKKQNAYLTEAFGKYISKDLLKQIIDRKHELKLGGERKLVTIFFSDIRGFTSISESILPENLVSLLNEYLDSMTEIILKNKGTLDKFIGDAVMAIWNAPLSQADHAKLACISAIEQVKALRKLNKKFRKKGLPELKIGCGINTGEVIVGNMGGKERFEYTVIGDSVNLASRLESLTKEYKVDIIISESTYELVKNDFKCDKLDKVKVKGKSIPVTIYKLEV